MGSIVARLRVILGADTDEYQARMNAAQAQMGEWKDEAVAGFKAVGAATGVAVVGLTAIAINQIKAAESSALLAQKVGVAAEQMSAFEYAASQYNIEGDAAAGVLEAINVAVSEYANIGVGAGTDFFETTGISAKKLAALRPDQQLLQIGAALDSMPQNTRIMFMDQMAGADGVALLDMLDNGALKMNAFMQEAKDLNVALSDIEVSQMAAASRSINRVGAALTGIGNSIAIGMAPYLDAASTQFVAMTKENNGWKDQIISNVRSIIKGVAYLGDAWHGLKVVGKGVEVVISGIMSGILIGLDETNQFFSSILIGMNEAYLSALKKPFEFLAPYSDAAASMVESINEMGDGVNKMLAPSQSLTNLAEAARESTAKLASEMSDLAMQKLPSDQVDQFFDKIESGSQAAAEKVVQAQQIAMTPPPIAEESASVLDQQKQQKIQADLMALEQSLMTERELISLHYSEQLLQVEGLMDSKAITLEQRNGFIEQLTAKHEDKLTQLANKGASDRAKFEAMTAAQKTKSVLGQMISLTAGVAQQNRTMFEVNKAAGTANAIINTYEGVSKAWSLGPILGPVMAGITLAAGLAQVNAIQSTSFGGGGSAPSVSGSGGGGASTVNTLPATPSAAANIQPAAESRANESQRSQGLTIYVQAENLYGQEDFANAVADAVKEADGRDIQMFVPGSRNLGMANA